jgi:hypothetical protein
MERIITIEPGDAEERGMPAVRISIDITNLPLMPFAFPDSVTYLSLSGPPGGPLYFIVKALLGPVANLDALQNSLCELYAASKRPAPKFGPRATVAIQDKTFPALLYFTGESMAASASCALVIQPPPERSSSPGLLVIFGHGGNPENVTSCGQLAEHSALGGVLKTLKWDLAIDPSDRKSSTPPKPKAPPPEPVKQAEEAVEIETQAEESPVVQRPAPTAATPAALLQFTAEICEQLTTLGYWSNEMPTQESYSSWSPMKIQMWSLQSTLQSMEQQLQMAAKTNPDQLVYGIVDMYKNWGSMLTEPAMANFKQLLERGPKS